MKMLFRLLSLAALVPAAALAQNTYTLDPLSSFGGRGDGSVQPGDSIGVSPVTGNNVPISAVGGIGIQPGDSTASPSSTNGYNMRGLSFDPVSHNLVFVDTHTGSGGATFLPPNAAIYILDSSSGLIIGALNTNGVTGAGGIGPAAAAAVADDGAVYVCNQINSSSSAFKIYRWATADTNNSSYGLPPVVAFNSPLSPVERLGQTIDVRGAGTNTQIIVGSGVQGSQPGTNVFLFTTADGTNFVANRLFFPGITIPSFNDGIAFGPGNTFFAKQVGRPLYYLSWDPVTFAGGVIASFTAASKSGTDPLLNLSGISVDNVHHLLAGLEEISGTASGGPGKLWLFDIYDASNKAPAILASRTYIPNLTKATAPMGYVDFGNGQVYANVVNNGLLASSVDVTSLSAPVFQLPSDYPSGQPRLTDLPATNRVAVGASAHWEAFAIADVTNWQWYSNNVPIPGANTYYYDLGNVTTNLSGVEFHVVASNAAGSTESVHSTLVVVSSVDFFHPSLLWSFAADKTNYISSTGGNQTPNERCIAYNALSNQLLVVKGPALGSVRVFVVDADTGAYLYPLNTNGMTPGGNLALAGIGVADDGAVYACNVASDSSFKVYRWADSGSNTAPVYIFGTNSSAGIANPLYDLLGNTSFRFGDNLAVHGAGNDTEIVMDSQNSSKYVSILRPTPDGTMTNWSETGYLLQNVAGSYGFGAYGTSIGRSLQFGPIINGSSTFWQKRYSTAGTPLAGMGYNPGGGLAFLEVANTGLPLYTNGPIGISFSLNLGAALNFAGVVGNNLTAPDTLDVYDMTDPSQAVLLSRQNLPGGNNGGHEQNGNAIGQVIFGANPTTGRNYIFAIEANNGIAAYELVGGVTPGPKLLAQPNSIRVIEGSSAALSVVVDQPATVTWFEGTNSPVAQSTQGATFTIAKASTNSVGDYFAVASNVNGSITSIVAHVSVGLTNDNYTLSPTWGAAAGNASFPYIDSSGGANTPNERSFAYNSLSNQLIVVKCPVSSSTYTVYVVDAGSGASLYTMNTTGVIHEGTSEVSGSNPIDITAVAVADDGAVYISSETPNASGGVNIDTTKMLHIYRWADSGPNTTGTVVYEGDPSGQPPGLNERWGDVLTVRGAGTNTQIFLNSNDGSYGAVLTPTDATLAAFTNAWFFDGAGGGSIGRSVQFGAGNTVFEKRKGAPLYLSSYNLTNQTTSPLLSVASPSTLGGVYVDLTRSLAAGVDFVGSATAPQKPDAVALYDLSVPSQPMLIAHYNFSINQVANANFISQTVIVGNKVYALDANNGLMAFTINPPASSLGPLMLNIASAGASVALSWSDSAAILQGSPSLSPPVWTDLTTAGQTNSVQPLAGASKFYRLRK